MAKIVVKVSEGEVYAIPLFVSDLPGLKRFTKKELAGEGREFCFMRVISDEKGGGIIIEVFNHVGGLDAPLDKVISAKRLFRPVAISGLAIYKKRWPFVGKHMGYDKEKDSEYSQIGLVVSPFDRPRLWQGGTERPLPPDKVSDYEPWTIWGAGQIEKRIIDALAAPGERGVSCCR
jgi:hypothetical protein